MADKLGVSLALAVIALAHATPVAIEVGHDGPAILEQLDSSQLLDWMTARGGRVAKLASLPRDDPELTGADLTRLASTRPNPYRPITEPTIANFTPDSWHLPPPGDAPSGAHLRPSGPSFRYPGPAE